MFKNINNAQQLIKYYSKKEQQNFGVAYYIFQKLWQGKILPRENYPDFQSVRSLIDKNKKEFQRTNFLELISNHQEFVEFVVEICGEEVFESKEAMHYLSKSGYGNIAKALEKEGVYQEIGSAYALFFDANIEDSSSQIRSNAKEEEWCNVTSANYTEALRAPFVHNNYIEYIVGPISQLSIYRPDYNFAYWPINPIGKHAMYASQGPVFSDNKKQNSFGFFYEMMFGGRNVKRDIKAIIAIGEPGKDFPNYFTGEHTFKCSVGNITMVIDVASISEPEESGEYSIHKIKLTLTKTIASKSEGKRPKVQKIEREIDVHAVSVKDGAAFKMTEENLIKFNKTFQSKLEDKKDFVVHCKDGLGLTGQCIAMIMMNKSQNFERLFADDDIKTTVRKIKGAVNYIRLSRPGLLRSPQQLWRFLSDSCQVHRINNLKQLNDNDSEITISGTNNKHEKDSLFASNVQKKNTPFSLIQNSDDDSSENYSSEEGEEESESVDDSSVNSYEDNSNSSENKENKKKNEDTVNLGDWSNTRVSSFKNKLVLHPMPLSPRNHSDVDPVDSHQITSDGSFN